MSREDAAVLAALEDFDRKQLALNEQLKQLPTRKKNAQLELDQLVREKKEKQQLKTDKEKRLKQIEQTIQDMQTKEGEKRGKLLAIKNQKEYDAIKAEITGHEQERDKLEEQMLLLMDEVSEMKDLLVREEKRVADVEAGLKRDMQSIDAEEKKIQEELAAFKSEQDRLIGGLSDDYRREYTKLRASLSNGQVLARIVEDDGEFRCSSCNFNISPQVVINVRRDAGLFACSTCHRILYNKAEQQQPADPQQTPAG